MWPERFGAELAPGPGDCGAFVLRVACGWRPRGDKSPAKLLTKTVEGATRQVQCGWYYFYLDIAATSNKRAAAKEQDRFEDAPLRSCRPGSRDVSELVDLDDHLIDANFLEDFAGGLPDSVPVALGANQQDH